MIEGSYLRSRLPLRQHRLNTLFQGLLLVMGVLALVNFLINVKAMFLLRSAFVADTDWASDFQRITRWMLAKIILPTDWSSPRLTDIDFFKLTSRYVGQNNQIVLGLALVEIVGVNALQNLQPSRRKAVTLTFGLVLMATLAVSRLSESFGSF